MQKILTLFTLCTISLALHAQSPLPSVDLKKLDGTAVSTDEIKESSKLTVLSFWATWCAPCKKELDAIADLYEDWQADYDMQLIAVTIDDARMISRVKPMVKTKGWPYEIWLDTDQALKEKLQFQTVPYTCIVDQDGNIVYKHNGYLPGDEEELAEKLAELSK